MRDLESAKVGDFIGSRRETGELTSTCILIARIGKTSCGTWLEGPTMDDDFEMIRSINAVTGRVKSQAHGSTRVNFCLLPMHNDGPNPTLEECFQERVSRSLVAVWDSMAA